MDEDLLAESTTVFNTTVLPDGTPGHVFSSEFASRKMALEMSILDAPVRKLVDMWQTCVRQARLAKLAVEDEIRAAERAHVRPPRFWRGTLMVTSVDRYLQLTILRYFTGRSCQPHIRLSALHREIHLGDV